MPDGSADRFQRSGIVYHASAAAVRSLSASADHLGQLGLQHLPPVFCEPVQMASGAQELARRVLMPPTCLIASLAVSDGELAATMVGVSCYYERGHFLDTFLTL